MFSTRIYMLISISITYLYQSKSTDAYCPGNPKADGEITFYYKENTQDRKDQMRNWGKLEETLEETKYKELKDFFDSKYVYAYTVTGECCWKVYNRTKFRGPSEVLSFGFGGIPNYPQFNVNSLMKIKCE